MSLVAALAAGAATAAQTGYGNSSYGSLHSFDSFNHSIRKRLESVRTGTTGMGVGGGYSGGYAPSRNYGAPSAPGAGAQGGYSNPNYQTPGFEQGYQGYNPAPAPGAPYGQNPAGYNPAPAYNNGGYNSGYTNNLNTNYNPANPGSNGYSYNTSAFSSDGAYAMAPSSRASSVASARRRQLDCVYTSGFTLWGDLYQTWGRQSETDGNDDSYRYRTFGPAIGLDWTSGGFTIGGAMTYNWGKLSARDISNDQKLETWALDLYGQYNADNFYVNGSIAYAHNRFDSDFGRWGGGRFNSNSFNLQGEFGWQFVFGGFHVTPNAGVRFFHDRRGSINDGELNADSRNYYTVELPLGVNLAYEINAGGMAFIPRARFAWIPEIARRRGAVTGTVVGGGSFNENGAHRAKNGFQAGLGMEARFTESLSAHVDYNINFRSREYEHHWNLGMGFSF